MAQYRDLPDGLENPQLDLGLYLLHELLLGQHHSLSEFKLSAYQHEWCRHENNCLIADELQYNTDIKKQL